MNIYQRTGFSGLLLCICTLTLLAFSACSPVKKEEKSMKDIHSYSEPDKIIVRHIRLDLDVNFDTHTLAGRATLEVNNIAGVDTLILDSRGLTIERVTLGEDQRETGFVLGDEQPFLGQPLRIAVDRGVRTVNIDYRTSPDAAALQWLAPEQTAGKKHPFLFTQSQAVLARTWVPCQDSPGVRFTFDARIRVPAGLMAVMGAENSQEHSPDGVYTFTMPQPIPSYLLALAVGDLGFRPLGERTGVYAEPSVLEKAAYEFADTEKMLEAAEQLYGPYRWGRYDIIVLPPSFPFGGMENPRLTFATPTILAGDRSLVSLIAHELAHSWSGNLVTNATWNDFWLNEGFTTYFENRIMEAVYGREFATMLAALGLQDLQRTIGQMGETSRDSHLFLDLAGRDPDEGMTDVAYEKGHFFLRMLENHFGRERWDAFLSEYFDHFAFKSMTTAGFLDWLDEKLLQQNPGLREDLRIDDWVYGPGLPENCPQPASEALRQVLAQAERWNAGARASELETSGWTTQHWLVFLRSLQDDKLSSERMLDLDRAFGFSDTGNSEILSAWLAHAIRHKYVPAWPALQDFLTRQGRRKFLKPLYQGLAQTPEGKEFALKIYQQARAGYHPISAETIDGILGL